MSPSSAVVETSGRKISSPVSGSMMVKPFSSGSWV